MPFRELCARLHSQCSDRLSYPRSLLRPLHTVYRAGRDRPAKLVNLGAPHYYVTSMDFITNGAALVVAGQTFKSGPNAPVEEGSLFCYANPEDWNMVSTGHLVRPKSIRIPAVRAITEDGGYIFISGGYLHKDLDSRLCRNTCFCIFIHHQ